MRGPPKMWTDDSNVAVIFVDEPIIIDDCIILRWQKGSFRQLWRVLYGRQQDKVGPTSRTVKIASTPDLTLIFCYCQFIKFIENVDREMINKFRQFRLLNWN